MTKAKAKLGEFVDEALAQLAELPQGPANEALVRLIDYTVRRVG
jgi:heptaprenyl diphosphate synthase